MSTVSRGTRKPAGLLRNVLELTHAGAALVGAAVADQQLQDALLTKMRKLSKRRVNDLFSGYGPLSSFSAKIDLAFAFELLDEEACRRLTAVRKIRNKFAHSDELFLTFASPDIVEILDSLPFSGSPSLDNQFRYMWHLQQVESHLVAVAGPTILKPSLPRPAST